MRDDAFLNNKKNHHFLSSVEQKLNAKNPNARSNNLKIYSFRLIDRERYLIELENPNGKSIYNNMSLFDLFSFDVLEVQEGRNIRANLEALFENYDTNMEVHSRNLRGSGEGGKSLWGAKTCHAAAR